MPKPIFVHLRLHSEFSVSDGIVRIDDAVARAAADGMPALALTDAANLFGMVKFYAAARAAGVKPVLGADCWIENSVERDKPGGLLSRAWLKNQHRAKPLIARERLQAGTEGLIALSGGPSGELAAALLSDH